MLKNHLKAAIISSLVVFPPVIGNPGVLHYSPLWIILIFGILASVLQPEYNPFTIGTRRKDLGTGAQIIWSVYVTQVGAIIECAYFRHPTSLQWDTVSTIAVTSMFLGLLLRTWAVVTLGDHFTMHLSIQQGHALIRSGPYRIMRHPSYVGALVMYVSTTLLLHAWIATIATMLILAIAFARRVYYEEKMLKDAFKAEFESYRAEVRL
jgi:protein-S-isoprenylcysteine O-methyltransferase